MTFMEKLNLLQVPIGATLRICGFEGSRTITTKLRQYGLFIGDKVTIVRQAPFSGPLLLEANGREIALGRGIAAKVFVETG